MRREKKRCAPKIHRGYKIVRVEDGKYRSCIQPDPKYAVRYKYGVWVRPRRHAGPLAVFGSRFTAWLFGVGNHSYERWEVHACQFRPSRANALWTTQRNRRLLKSLPNGTFLASAVRLGRKVDSV